MKTESGFTLFDYLVAFLTLIAVTLEPRAAFPLMTVLLLLIYYRLSK